MSMRPVPTCLVPCVIQFEFELIKWSLVNLQMLSHAAQKIAEMHETGYVHRDLKPENILFREAASKWFLIGFSHVAKAGKMAPLAVSPKYAAPESILAEDCGVKDVPVHPSVDAWALGVIAFELLVGKRSFAAHSDSKVCSSFLLMSPQSSHTLEEVSSTLLRYLNHKLRECDLACALQSL